jgi:hypothetical protein
MYISLKTKFQLAQNLKFAVFLNIFLLLCDSACRIASALFFFMP